MPVAIFLTDQITNEKIKDFINESIPPKNSMTSINDLKLDYDTVMYELEFVHQYYIFI